MRAETIKFTVGKVCTKSFANEWDKIPKIKCASISKEILKGDYKFLFEFFNKVIFPQFEKWIVVSSADLFLMKALSKINALNLHVHMLEQMPKTMIS